MRRSPPPPTPDAPPRPPNAAARRPAPAGSGVGRWPPRAPLPAAPVAPLPLRGCPTDPRRGHPFPEETNTGMRRSTYVCMCACVCVCPCGWGGERGVHCVPGACVLARARVFLCGWIGDFNWFYNNPCPPLGMVSVSTTAHRRGDPLVFSPAVLARGFRPSLPAPPPFPVTSSALTAASHLLDSEPKLSCLTGPFLTARM